MTDAKLAVYNGALDAAIDHRVTLHHLRAAGDIDVPAYLAGLRAVRDVEDRLEPLRRRAGARHTRAFELSGAASISTSSRVMDAPTNLPTLCAMCASEHHNPGDLCPRCEPHAGDEET